MRSRWGSGLALGAAWLCLLIEMWVVVPAPGLPFFVLGLIGAERGLFVAAVALVALVWTAFARRGSRFLRAATIAPALLAIALSFWPYVSVTLAKGTAPGTTDASLSWNRYFAGSFGRTAPLFTTVTFAPGLALDAYPAAPAVRTGAAVVVIHGGAWSRGERSEEPRSDQWLADSGYTVFDVEYHLAPQPNADTSIADIKCAIRWVKANAAAYGVSPDRLVLLGRSAGAHLALLAAYTPNDPRLSASCLTDDARDERVAGVVSLYGPTDLAWDYAHPGNARVLDGQEALRQYLGGAPGDSAAMAETYRAMSPIEHVSATSPPTLLIQGGRDQIVSVENARRLAAALHQHGRAVDVLELPYADHAFDMIVDGWGAQLARPVIARFLRTGVLAGSAEPSHD